MAYQTSNTSTRLEESRANDLFPDEIDKIEQSLENVEIGNLKGKYMREPKPEDRLYKNVSKDKYQEFKIQAKKHSEGEYARSLHTIHKPAHDINKYLDRIMECTSKKFDRGNKKIVDFSEKLETRKIEQPITEQSEESSGKSLLNSIEHDPALLDIFDRCFTDKVMKGVPKEDVGDDGKCDFLKDSKKKIKGRQFKKVERKIEIIPKPLKGLKMVTVKETIAPLVRGNSKVSAYKISDYYRKSGISQEGRRNVGRSSTPSGKETARRSRITTSCHKCYKQSFNWKLRQINEIEERLKQHPLALYPHLEEYIPYNIFEEVTEILDPEMKKALNEDNYVDPHRLDDFSEMFKFVPATYGLEGEEEEVNKIDEDVDSHKAKELLYKLQKGIPIDKVNPYKAIFIHDEREKKATLISRLSKAKYTSMETEEVVSPVTREFCDYLGLLSQEEKNVITEEDVHGLFASGIDTKPPLSVPIQFVAMEGIPLELRRLTGGPDAVELMKERVGLCEDVLNKSSRVKSAKPKFRFGAWYLDPNEWRKLPQNEPLVDPKHSTVNILEANIKDLELDDELATMHGTKLFLEFSKKKKKRKPEFLKNVIRIMSEIKVVDEKTSNIYSVDRE